MAQVYVKYNPYKLETTIEINGNALPADSALYKLTKGKRLQEWIGDFPKMLRDDQNELTYSLVFRGMDLDWDDFKDAFERAQSAGVLNISDMKFVGGKSDDDINEKIVSIFHDLQEGPVEDFRNDKLIRAFNNINNAVFPVNVIATMSSGKSTLVNALLHQKLMPAKNAACTATITEIHDADTSVFAAIAYDRDNVALREIPRLTYEEMTALNEDPQVHHINVQGDIPFLDAKSMALTLVDTPGPNNAQNQEHKNMTYREISNDSNNLILYVLNATQLNTTDDDSLLRYVAEQIRRGGKQMRDRFLFVINKMDEFNPEEESVAEAIQSARQRLAEHGIEDPQLFPCSAFAALSLRTVLADIDIDQLTRQQERQLPSSTQKALNMVYRLVDHDALHLEQYSTLSPSAKQELDYRLKRAIEAHDTKEQALIHSGICSIEAAITAYVKKYAKTKKVKDLVESFREVLESSKVLANAKSRVATDEEAAKACVERATAVRQKIDDGKEAEAFKEKIAALDPMPSIREKAERLQTNAYAKTSRIFHPYGETLTSREEAKRLVSQFSTLSSDSMAELTSELEGMINQEIVDTGKRLLLEYQEKLSRFDESSTNEHLDFQTVDLIKGTLQTMRETAETWTTNDFAAETVENIGETTYEDRTYYEKVGQEEEEVVVGSHEEKVGTRKVKVGSHKEQVGTRTVKKSGFFAAIARIFGGGYEDVPVYETVDDYEEEDVYKTVLDYKKIMRDVFEEKTERIEKFSLPTKDLQETLLGTMRQNLDEGLEKALVLAAEQIQTLKSQFSSLFDELDKVIAEKYAELERYATDASEKETALQQSRRLLEWIETNISEIDALLDM